MDGLEGEIGRMPEGAAADTMTGEQAEEVRGAGAAMPSTDHARKETFGAEPAQSGAQADAEPEGASTMAHADELIHKAEETLSDNRNKIIAGLGILGMTGMSIAGIMLNRRRHQQTSPSLKDRIYSKLPFSRT